MGQQIVLDPTACLLLLVSSRFTHVAAVSLGHLWAGKTRLVLIPRLAGDAGFVWSGCWLGWRKCIGQHIEVTELQGQKVKAFVQPFFKLLTGKCFYCSTGQSKFCGQAQTQSNRENQDSEEGTNWVHCRLWSPNFNTVWLLCLHLMPCDSHSRTVIHSWIVVLSQF